MSREYDHLLLSNLETKDQRGKRTLNPKKESVHGHLSVGRPQLNFKYSGRTFGPVQPLRIRRFLGLLDETIARKKNKDSPVALYIPGWNHKALVTLDLFRSISERYAVGKNAPISTFIFFQWMTGEFTDIINKRHQIDDGAWEQAQACGQLMEQWLASVSEHLHKKGIPFYLMTHSYAHQFLNSLLNVWGADGSYERIFDKTFLFAPDITWRSMKESPGGKGGIKLVNPNGTDENYRHFDLTPLTEVSDKTHVLSCSWDYLLHHSQSMNLTEVTQYARRKGIKIKPQDYVGLGVSGGLWNKHSNELAQGIQVHEVFDLIEPEYKEVVNDKHRMAMEAFFGGKVPEQFKSTLKVALNASKWADLHRYVFLSDNVHRFLREELEF